MQEAILYTCLFLSIYRVYKDRGFMTPINGGFYGAKINEYSKVGNSGMSRTEFREYYMQQSQEHSAQVKTENNIKNISNLQQAGAMYGLNLDSQSIFQLADKNGDGYISNKEASSAMSKMGQIAYMNQMNGGQSIGGNNAMGFLNQFGNVAGNVTGGGENGGSSGGFGEILGSAVNTVKSWFS